MKMYFGHAVRTAAASIGCAMLFAACGITPLYNPPIGEDSEKMLDAETTAKLLKTGELKQVDENVTVKFSVYESDSDSQAANAAEKAARDKVEKYVVRMLLTSVDEDDNKKPVTTTLPLLLVPFRYDGGELFFYLTLDGMKILETTKLNPQFIFMMHPYHYILKAEPKDGGWEVGFVQFATTGREIKKVCEKAELDKDGTVMNPTPEILQMLKDRTNYEIVQKMTFLPIGAEKSVKK